MKRAKILALVFVILLWSCEEKKELLPLEEPPQEDLVEEEEISLTPEELAIFLIGDEASIISVKRGLYNAEAVLEVLVEKEKEQFLYLIDPREEKIISLTKKEETSDEMSLEQAHFLARGALEGNTELRAIKVFEDHYLFTFEKENKGWEVSLDKASQRAEMIGEVALSELLGSINMDLFQAINKTEIIYGKLDIKEIYYEPWNDTVSHIVIKAQQNVEGEVLSKIFEMDTYSGVISVKSD